MLQVQENAADGSAGFEVLDSTNRAYNDTMNAEALIVRYGDLIRYVRGWGWLAYDGARWVKDAEADVIEFAKDTLRALGTKALTFTDSADRKRLLDHVNRSLDMRDLSNMVKSAQSDRRIRAKVEDFDRDPWLLNVRNGTVDLRTGERREHRPEDLITHIAGTDYDPDASCPEWEQFISDIMAGDANMVEYLQRAFGYSLTGVVSEKAFFFGYGPTGDNGKSTMLETFLPVMGTYGAAPDWRTFLSAGGNGRGIATDLAGLVGVRYAISSEPAKGATLRTDRLKNMTGGDTMTACNLYEKEFTFSPQLKYWLSANDEPDVPESGNAFWRRIRKIPFTQNFTATMDKGLKDRMIANELPGILAWAVRGCMEWQARGKLDEPAVMRDALQDYRDAQDPFLAFVKERCEVKDDARTLGKEMHTAYGEWCVETFGQWEGSKKADISPAKFYEVARQHGYTVQRMTGGQTVFGLHLKVEMPTPYYGPRGMTADEEAYLEALVED